MGEASRRLSRSAGWDLCWAPEPHDYRQHSLTLVEPQGLAGLLESAPHWTQAPCPCVKAWRWNGALHILGRGLVPFWEMCVVLCMSVGVCVSGCSCVDQSVCLGGLTHVMGRGPHPPRLFPAGSRWRKGQRSPERRGWSTRVHKGRGGREMPWECRLSPAVRLSSPDPRSWPTVGRGQSRCVLGVCWQPPRPPSLATAVKAPVAASHTFCLLGSEPPTQPRLSRAC